MKLGMPEILAAGSVVLLATGNSTVGWVFLGLAATCVNAIHFQFSDFER